MKFNLLVADNKFQLSRIQYDSIIRLLPARMEQQASRFKFWKDAQAYMFGKLLTLRGLINYGYDLSVLKNIEYNAFGKPFLPDSEINFNVSHSGHYVICCLARQLKIGIDIEMIKPLDLSDFQTVLTTEELSDISETSDSTVELLKLWTIKEAVVKADGRGFSLPLQKIQLAIENKVNIDGDTWYIYRIVLDPDYMVHIAANEIVHADNILYERINMTEESFVNNAAKV
jgi:4'-phosphopantetheinyl transferase